MGELLDKQSPGRVDRWSRSYATSSVKITSATLNQEKIMNNETSNGIMGFVKTHFFKIMGVFLIIGLIQYACSDKEPVVVETVNLIDRFDAE